MTTATVKVLRVDTYLLGDPEGTEDGLNANIPVAWVSLTEDMIGPYTTYLVWLDSLEDYVLMSSARATGAWVRWSEEELLPLAYLARLDANPVDPPSIEMYQES